MTKKFIIKEIWLLDEKGNKKMELNPVDLNTSMTVKEDAKGGNLFLRDGC